MERYLALLGGLPEGAWGDAWASGKWTRSEVTEHLVLAYEAMLRELAGEGPMRPRVGAAWSTLLRWLLLPHILFHRSLPIRAKAPRETRPTASSDSPTEGARRLDAVTRHYERAIAAAHRAGGQVMRHPYFGPVPPLRLLRLSTVHLEHHRRQIGSPPISAGP